MRIVPFFFMFLLQGSLVLGQASYLTRTIEWQNPKAQPQAGNIKDITSFSNSYYRDIKALFPYYHENISLQEGSKPDLLSFIRTETQPINPDHLPDHFLKKLTTDFPLEFYTSLENGNYVMQYTIFPFRINPVSGKPERLMSFALRLDQTRTPMVPQGNKRKSHSLKN
ncbi:MAG: hypothetical protein ACOCUP_02805, partial [bacterium]